MPLHLVWGWDPRRPIFLFIAWVPEIDRWMFSLRTQLPAFTHPFNRYSLLVVFTAVC